MMRTSRVGHPVSQMYQQAKRVNEGDGVFSQAFEGRHQDPREQLPQQKKKKKAPVTKTKKLVTTKSHVIVKGMQFDGDSTVIRNQLIRESLKLATLTKYRRRIGTYRTSV